MPEKFAPGSFTKNYGWNRSPPGFNKLHENIRRGFSGHELPVTRDDFRSRHGAGPALVAVNFFLHNTIIGGVNHVTADELVRRALTADHSRAFDQLALFALHLGRVGQRAGHSNGTPEGAGFANDYVRNRLWRSGAWAKTETAIEAIKARFNDVVAVTGKGDAGKTATNYHFMLELAGLTGQPSDVLNSRWPEWIGSAAFLFFDRVSIDHFPDGSPSTSDLLAASQETEFHKLVGGEASDIDHIVAELAVSYLEVGGFARPWANGPMTATANLPAGLAAPTESNVTWTDEAALEAEVVERRRREVEAQLRNPKNVRQLKAAYDNRCMFCERQIVVGVDPQRLYSEAAHIRPLGKPHNGPDTRRNMILLCPEHHLQFDRGILRLKYSGGAYLVQSRLVGDLLQGKKLEFHASHTLDQAHVDWHFEFWSPA